MKTQKKQNYFVFKIHHSNFKFETENIKKTISYYIAIFLILTIGISESFAGHNESQWADPACGVGGRMYSTTINTGCGNKVKCTHTQQSCFVQTNSCSSSCGPVAYGKASISLTYGPGGISITEYRRARGFTGACGTSPTLSDSSPSFSRCNMHLNFILDSVQNTVSLVFDSALFSISNFIPNTTISDSSFYVFNVSLFVPQSIADTFPNLSNMFWNGQIVLFNGSVNFLGNLTSAGFIVNTVPDSVYVTASNLTKVVSFAGSNADFQKIRIYTSGEGSYGDPQNCIPVTLDISIIPTLSQWGLIIFGIVLLSVGVFYIAKR